MAGRTLRLGLRYKIIFIIVTGVVLIEVIANIIDYYSSKRLLLRELDHQHSVIAAELNQALIDVSVAGTSSAPQALVLTTSAHHIAQTLVASDKILLSIVSYQVHNGIFSHGTLIGGRSSYPNPSYDTQSLRSALETGRNVHYIDHNGSAILLKTFVPVQMPTGTPYVNEFITNYRQAFQSEFQQQLKTSLLVSFGILFLTIVCSYALGWYIAHPILKLQRHIANLKSTTYADPLHIQRNDEIGDLANHVNDLSVRLSLDFNRLIHDERSSTMKYLGMISQALIHELRSPAVASRNLLKLLPDIQTLTPQARKALMHITTSVDHLNNVLDDFSYMIREGHPLEMTNHDVAEIVQQAIDICTPLAQKRGIVIETVPSPGRYIARVDTVRLRMVILNVLRNALDAMEHVTHDGKVRVNMSIDVHQLSIDVVDQGPGIPLERWTEIFTPFKTTKKDGFGLGLALSAMLIIGMGGNIFVKESTESGTTIRATLPPVELSGTRNRFFTSEDRVNNR